MKAGGGASLPYRNVAKITMFLKLLIKKRPYG
jgi:hypothetical protein